MAKSNEKKRHHYVPIAYISGFSKESGRIFAYRKDNKEVRPPHGAVELIFPISPRTAIRGRLGPLRLIDNVLVENRPVERINRFVARFGYRFGFANDRAHDAVVTAHSATSPIGHFTSQPTPAQGEAAFFSWAFGPRPSKPKWERPERDTANPA